MTRINYCTKLYNIDKTFFKEKTINKVLDIHEIAQYLGISEVTVYRKAREGEIPGVRVGRKWKFPMDIIKDWLRNKAGKELGTWQYNKVNKGKKKLKIYKCGGMKGGLRREELYSDR